MEEIRKLFEQLTQENKSILLLVAQSLQVAQKSG